VKEVGCFGFNQQGFECIAPNEILTKRLIIQTFINKCKYATGYLDGDISTKENVVYENENREIVINYHIESFKTIESIKTKD
jgi:DNA (cytosine-5)-methyltransferase 1